eukprot:13167614-Alexandrium_andersonii.AAC.1
MLKSARSRPELSPQPGWPRRRRKPGGCIGLQPGLGLHVLVLRDGAARAGGRRCAGIRGESKCARTRDRRNVRRGPGA